ncbi:MAG: F0F1 ATP synthase subunit delta [Actinomycetes bacterium]
MIILGGSSRQSLARLRGTLDESLKGLSAVDCATVSADLFTVLTALSSSVSLRRALTDPSRDAQSKASLNADIFAKVIGKTALSLVDAATASRWSSPGEFADAIEQIAVEAQASSANLNNELDRVQDEIFEFSRILLANGDLRQALSNQSDEIEHKQALIRDIFSKTASSSTVALLTALVAGVRGRSIEQTLAAYTHAVAARRDRVTAHVRSAVALSATQREKLVSTLAIKIGQPVHVNSEIDSSVLGGIVIRFADEIIDGTIANRLAEASRALVAQK